MSRVRDIDGLLMQPNPNLLINGDFSVWQRGDPITQGGYTVDRWETYFGNGTGQVRDGTFAVGSVMRNLRPDSRVVEVNQIGASSTQITHMLGQRIENPRNYSGNTLTYSFAMASNRHTELMLNARYTVNGVAKLIQQESFAITGTAEEFSFTFTMPDVHNESGFTEDDNLSVVISETASDFGKAGTIYFAGAKLEVGSFATDFIADDPQTNLAKCQRYYQRQETAAAAGLGLYTIGKTVAGNTYYADTLLPVTMRANPVFTLEVADTSGAAFQGIDVNDLSQFSRFARNGGIRLGYKCQSSVTSDTAASYIWSSYNLDAEL